MKILSVDFAILGLIALAAFGLIAPRVTAPCCRPHDSTILADGEAPAALRLVSLTVDGMPCAQCEVAIRTAVKKLHGVQKVSFNEGRAMVLYDPAIVTPQRMMDAAGAVGFGASIARGAQLATGTGKLCLPARRFPEPGA